MQPPKDNIHEIRNAAFVILAALMVLAFTSSRLGISLAGALAFWGIVIAFTSVIALFSAILLHR